MQPRSRVKGACHRWCLISNGRGLPGLQCEAYMKRQEPSTNRDAPAGRMMKLKNNFQTAAILLPGLQTGSINLDSAGLFESAVADSPSSNLLRVKTSVSAARQFSGVLWTRIGGTFQSFSLWVPQLGTQRHTAWPARCFFGRSVNTVKQLGEICPLSAKHASAPSPSFLYGRFCDGCDRLGT